MIDIGIKRKMSLRHPGRLFPLPVQPDATTDRRRGRRRLRERVNQGFQPMRVGASVVVYVRYVRSGSGPQPGVSCQRESNSLFREISQIDASAIELSYDPLDL